MSTLILTGGSRGIGAATAKSFARKGWKIAFCYRAAEQEAMELQSVLTNMGTSVLAYQADLTDSKQAEAFISEAVRQLGAPDALVCNAGVALPQDVLTHVTDEQWRALFAADVDSLFYTVRAALPHFIRQQHGSIVTVASMWGQVGASCEVAYSAAKGAVIAFTKALAKEVGPSGIRVNCVSPGVIATEMNSHLSAQTLLELSDETYLGRIGAPDDVARCIRFLCSEDASYVTGQILAPNGGFVI